MGVGKNMKFEELYTSLIYLEREPAPVYARRGQDLLRRVPEAPREKEGKI